MTEVTERVVSIDPSLMQVRLPAGWGRFSEKLLLPLFFIETDEIIKATSNHPNEELAAKILDIIDSCSKLYGQPVCPICRQAKVSYFIMPDLNLNSPCFKRSCCDKETCWSNLAHTYNVSLVNIQPIALMTAVVQPDANSRRIIAKFIRDICGLPRRYDSPADEANFIKKFKLALSGDMMLTCNN